MRFTLAIAALGMVLSSLTGTARAVEPEFILKFHHMLPPMSGAHRDFIAPWAKKIEKESGGRIQVDIFPAMQLGGKPPQLFDQARKGVVDLTWTVGGYTRGRFPSAEVFELPFMPANAEATSMALQEYAEQEMQSELKDVHLLAMHTHAPGTLHSRDKPIHSARDLKSVTLRAPNKRMAEAMSGFGVNSVFMPVPQMPSALSKGILDATMLPYEVVAPLKIHQLVKYHTGIPGERGLYTQFFLFVMNKKSYNRLPDDLKKVIDNNSGVELAGFIGRQFDNNERVGYEVAKAQGNEIYELPKREVLRWKREMAPVSQEWIADMNKKGRDGQAMYDKANSLIRKYEAQVAARPTAQSPAVVKAD